MKMFSHLAAGLFTALFALSAGAQSVAPPAAPGKPAPDVLIFTNGGLDRSTAVCGVEAVDGKAVFTDGPYVETKEHLGGFTVVDVADEEAARLWAGKIAEACGWPQEVRRFKPQFKAR